NSRRYLQIQSCEYFCFYVGGGTKAVFFADAFSGVETNCSCTPLAMSIAIPGVVMTVFADKFSGSSTSADDIVNDLLTVAPHDYDCVVGNVAALLGLHRYEPDRVLGSAFCAAPASDAEGKLSFGHLGARQLERAVHTGLLRYREFDADGDLVPSLPYVAIGDAFEMAWTPYHGRKHIEHGFLVLGVDLAFDAYRTITEFGEAVPTVIADHDLRAVSVQRRMNLLIGDVATDFTAGPVAYQDHDAASRYGRLLDEQMLSLEHLALDTWLVARARRVNARYRTAYDGRLGEELAASVEAWTRSSELVYMALRRSRRGRPVPHTYVDAIAAALAIDTDIAGRWSQ
ncbi:hypothetical protein ACFWFQ_33380, partial [Nocardia salmonicida]|uniref:hypothetical protein n=1 Tax=Nocardia salmonicida TaxID=53431 RepID=UPI003659AABB